jgi:hypothetical protein
MSHCTPEHSGYRDTIDTSKLPPLKCGTPDYSAPPTTGEVHIEHYFPKGYNPDDEPWKSIREHHKQKLAAERERLEAKWKASMVDVTTALQNYEQKLAAEKKEHEQEMFEQWNKAAIEIEKLKRQLELAETDAGKWAQKYMVDIKELRDILKAVQPFAKAWACEEIEDKITDALKKEPPPLHYKD